MTDKKFITLQDLRQPGMRRVLEAMKTIRDDAPALFDEAPIAAQQLSNGCSESGQLRSEQFMLTPIVTALVFGNCRPALGFFIRGGPWCVAATGSRKISDAGLDRYAPATNSACSSDPKKLVDQMTSIR